MSEQAVSGSGVLDNTVEVLVARKSAEVMPLDDMLETFSDLAVKDPDLMQRVAGLRSGVGEHSERDGGGS